MRKEFKYLIGISMAFALLVLLVNGLRLTWNEEALLYAIYGATVGFYAAIVGSMLLVWKLNKKNRK